MSKEVFEFERSGLALPGCAVVVVDSLEEAQELVIDQTPAYLKDRDTFRIELKTRKLIMSFPALVHFWDGDY